MRPLQFLIWTLLLPLTACQGPSTATETTSQSQSSGVIKIAQAGAKPGQINFRDPLYRRFTDRFSTPAVLIADRIEVHGPSDLLEHLAVRQDSQGFESKLRTTKDGLRQDLTRRPQVVGGEAFAQLDQWKLYALHKLIVVQAPDDQPVRVLAVGQAVFLPEGEGAQEIKQESISFTGEHGQQ